MPRLQLPSAPRRAMACVYSKCSRHDKQEVDLFLDSMNPYDQLMGPYNDDLWSSNPTRPWYHDLTSMTSSTTHEYPDVAARDAWMPFWSSNRYQTYPAIITIQYKCRYRTASLLKIRQRAPQGKNTTTLAAKLLNDVHTQDGYVAVLDIAKAFLSVSRSMLTNIVKEAGTPATIKRMLGEICQHTRAVLSQHRRDLPIRPTRRMEEGCPLSPMLLLLY